mgnify:CR=1 FL=1
MLLLTKAKVETNWLVDGDILIHNNGSHYVFERPVDGVAFLGHILGQPKVVILLQYDHFTCKWTKEIRVLTRIRKIKTMRQNTVSH